jgi:hypothetical protein
MAECCPPGRGCNAPDGGEPCALTLCHVAADEEGDAALALDRWQALEEASEGDGERRFRRRAFQRARDQALIALAMKAGPRIAARRAPLVTAVRSARSRSRRRDRLAHR